MSSISVWTRQHRLFVFFGLAVAIAWGPWPFYAADLSPFPFLPCGPLVAALVVIGVTEGRSGYKTLTSRMIRWRVGGRWWLAALGLPLAVLAVAALANIMIWGAPAPALAGLAWSGLAVTFAGRFVDPLDGPLGEEPGWRGYALPQLQYSRPPLVAGLVLAGLVTMWHLPLVLTGQLDAIGLIGTLGITLVYVWLFNRTGGSVLMTMVFHVAQGTVSYAALGFDGADSARMALLASSAWCVIAIGLIVVDRKVWLAGSPAAIVARPHETQRNDPTTGRCAVQPAELQHSGDTTIGAIDRDAVRP